MKITNDVSQPQKEKPGESIKWRLVDADLIAKQIIRKDESGRPGLHSDATLRPWYLHSLEEASRQSK